MTHYTLLNILITLGSTSSDVDWRGVMTKNPPVTQIGQSIIYSVWTDVLFALFHRNVKIWKCGRMRRGEVSIEKMNFSYLLIFTVEVCANMYEAKTQTCCLSSAKCLSVLLTYVGLVFDIITIILLLIRQILLFEQAFPSTIIHQLNDAEFI